jgi:hypothetical protein
LFLAVFEIEKEVRQVSRPINAIDVLDDCRAG